MLLGLSIAAAVIIFDQLTKYYMLNYVLNEYGFIGFSPYFNLVRAWNTGVSFSMFNDHGSMGKIALSALALVIVGFLVNWLRKEQNRFLQVSLGFVIGGALGNVIDRIRLGAVFDFLDFHIGDTHWPAFNAADSFICIGAVMIIIHGLFWNKKKDA